MSPIRWLLALLLALMIHAGLLLWFVINSNNLKDVEPFKDKDEGMVISLAGMAGESAGGAGNGGSSSSGAAGGPAAGQALVAKEPIAEPVASLPLSSPLSKREQEQPLVAKTFEISEAELRAIREAETQARAQAVLEEAHSAEQQRLASKQRREAEVRRQAEQRRFENEQRLLANEERRQKKNERPSAKTSNA